MTIYQHPTNLWSPFLKHEAPEKQAHPKLPTRIRLKNNGDGTGTARLIEAPPAPRRSSFSLFHGSTKPNSRRKLSFTLSRFTSEHKHREDEGVDGCHLSSTGTGFDILIRLPVELATQILQFCDLKSILAAQLVCKSWHRLANQNQIWHSLILQRPAWKLPQSEEPVHNYADLYKRRIQLMGRWKSGQVDTRYLEGHQDSVYCIQFDDHKIVSGSRDKTIKIWDPKTYKCLHTLNGHTASVLCIRYQDNTLVSGSSDATIRVWDLETKECTMQLNGHESGVLDVCFNEQYIISCSKDTTIRVWDRITGDLVTTLDQHRGPVNAVQVKGDQLVSAAGDGMVKLWDLKTFKMKREFAGHTRGLACVQFDGNTIISGSNDKKIKVWNANTGECIRTLEGHEDLVRTLCFNEELIVSGSYDQTIRVWDMMTGSCILCFQTGHPAWVFSTMFNATRIISSSQDNKILCIDFSKGVNTKHITL